MPFNTVKKGSADKGKAADLEQEDQKRIELYHIYGNQNPTPKTYRGRRVP
jgi:hypothetical protein